MSDVLTINTEDNIIRKETIEPLPLYDDKFAMLDDEIPNYGDPLPNPIMSELAQRLKMTMKKFGGLGLSANQCGVYERVFVIGHEDNAFICINPKVIEQSDELIREKEGCLSYPGMFLSVPRPKWVIAEFVNENGQTQQMRFEGLTARCYLHELDHMNGIKFVQHVGPVSIRMARDKQQKTIKKFQRQFKTKSSVFF
jgi:peptide deformylase